MNRALVTGAKGMLGTDLCQELIDNGFTVFASDIDEMDVRDRASITNVIEEFRPDMVFHLAALTDVDGCERQPEDAYHTNTVGTQLVALACMQQDIPMTYISTISVFDGTKCEAYTEFDTPNPQSWYSRSKYEGEKIVENLLNKYFIVRAGWMFGGGKEDKKFVARITELAQTRNELKIVDDKFGSPTYTRDFSKALIYLNQIGLYGLYHAVNTGSPVSRFEFAGKILQYAGIGNCRIEPVSSANFPLPAPRPRMEAARNLHAELLNLPIMRPWEHALKEYIDQVILVPQIK